MQERNQIDSKCQQVERHLTLSTETYPKTQPDFMCSRHDEIQHTELFIMESHRRSTLKREIGVMESKNKRKKKNITYMWLRESRD